MAGFECNRDFSSVTASLIQMDAQTEARLACRDGHGRRSFVIAKANSNCISDDEPMSIVGKRVSAFRHFSVGRSTRRSKARSAARMTCDCLSPVSSLSRCKILRSASVSRIVVFCNFNRCRMTKRALQSICRIVWRKYGGGGIGRRT